MPSMTDWNDVVRQHGPLVFRIALRIVGQPADAEDVCQEVFCDAYRFQRSKRVDNWAGFLRRLATLRAVDRLRRAKPTIPLTGVDVPSRGDSPPDVAIAGELEGRLRQALAQLPQQQAAIFSLRYFESLTNSEIADTLDIATSAVSTALFKARARLTSLLRDVPQGEAK